MTPANAWFISVPFVGTWISRLSGIVALSHKQPAEFAPLCIRLRLAVPPPTVDLFDIETPVTADLKARAPGLFLVDRWCWDGHAGTWLCSPSKASPWKVSGLSGTPHRSRNPVASRIFLRRIETSVKSRTQREVDGARRFKSSPLQQPVRPLRVSRHSLLQLVEYPGLIATEVYTARKLDRASSRALELCQQLGETEARSTRSSRGRYADP